MKTLKTFYKLALSPMQAVAVLTALMLAVLTIPAAPAHAEEYSNPTAVVANITTISTDVAALVYHIGDATYPSGKVAVAANGDITFTSGAYGAEAAETEFECPVSGALGGIIDVSDTACDTMGEVADVINASTHWRMVLIGALRSDSSNDTLKTFSAADANAREGLALNFDDAVNFSNSIALIPSGGTNIQEFLSGPNTAKKLIPRPFLGTRTKVIYDTATSTYASGTSNLYIYSVKMTNNPSTGKGSETVTTILGPKAGGATTVASASDWSTIQGVLGNRDEKVIVRLVNSAAMTAVTHSVYGIQYQYK